MKVAIIPTSSTNIGEHLYKLDFLLSENINPKGINPTKIKSIWGKKFNNTILATSEFGQRIPFIHKTCDGNVLDLYVNNLGKNLYEIDEMVLAYLGANHELYSVFESFAEQHQGTINIKDRALKKLNALYEKRQFAFQEAINKTNQSYYKEMAHMDTKALQEKSKQVVAEYKREDSNYRKEYDINLKSVCKQLGIEKTGTIPEDVYRVTIADPGWVNIDMIVAEKTLAKQTIDILDSTSGKRAIIKYESFEIEVENKDDYDRMYAYLLPKQLNSFQRMKDTSNGFQENLNELITYEWCVIGYKGAQPYWYYGKDIPSAKVDKIRLEKVKDSKIRKTINSRNSNEQKSEMIRDLNFHSFEYEEEIRQNKITNDLRLREKIRETIFPCFDSLVLG